MKTPEDRLDATCRISDAESRRLLTALNLTGRDKSKVDTQRGYPVESWGDTLVDAPTDQSRRLAAAPAMRKWTRSYVRRLRERDFVAQATLRPPLIGWIAFVAGFIARFAKGRRRRGGTVFGIIVDESILDLLGITPEAELDVTADGASLVITPRFLPRSLPPSLPPSKGRGGGNPDGRAGKGPAGTLRKLAW